MSVLGSIMSAIFGRGAPPASQTSASPASQTSASPAAPAGSATAANKPAGSPGPATTGAAPAAQPSRPQTVDVEAVLTNLAKQKKEKLDWRKSIVDLMKLLDLDSSLTARKQLAQELHYTGDTNDSAKMNIWLHKQVMTKLAENGGKVPAELRH